MTNPGQMAIIALMPLAFARENWRKTQLKIGGNSSRPRIVGHAPSMLRKSKKGSFSQSLLPLPWFISPFTSMSPTRSRSGVYLSPPILWFDPRSTPIFPRSRSMQTLNMILWCIIQHSPQHRGTHNWGPNPSGLVMAWPCVTFTLISVIHYVRGGGGERGGSGPGFVPGMIIIIIVMHPKRKMDEWMPLERSKRAQNRPRRVHFAISPIEIPQMRISKTIKNHENP